MAFTETISGLDLACKLLFPALALVPAARQAESLVISCFFNICFVPGRVLGTEGYSEIESKVCALKLNTWTGKKKTYRTERHSITCYVINVTL